MSADSQTLKQPISNTKSRWLHRPAILLILLLALFLRTHQLDHQALRGDEAATVLYSAMPINQLWELSRVTDPHPPLYYLLLHPWQWLIGEEGWVMRYAGVIASTLAVAVLYALAQQTLRSTKISLPAATLLAINPLQIWLAQDVRSYPFFTLLGLLSSWALWSALQPSATSTRCILPKSKGEASRIEGLDANKLCSDLPRPYATCKFDGDTTRSGTQNTSRLTTYASRFIPWLLYIFFTIACLYIHYYTVFLIAFQGLFFLININKFRDKKWSWLASQITIGVCIIPGLRLAYNFIGQAAGGIDKIPTQDILRLASTALLTGFTIEASWGLWISLLLIPIWITGIVSLLRHNFITGTFWTLFFVVPVLGVIALSVNRPFFKERFLIQAQPAFELLLAAGFLTLWQAAFRYASRILPAAPRTALYTLRFLISLTLAALIFANALALSNYFTDSAYAKAPPWHLYGDYVTRRAAPNDVMLTNFPEASVSYYSPNSLPFYVVPVERDRSRDFRLEQTEQIANAYERIWFLPLLRQGFDEQGDVLTWLDRHGDRVNQIFFPVYNLNLYLSPPTIDEMLVAQPTQFAHGIDLRGFQVLDEQGRSRLERADNETTFRLKAEPEDELTLSLYWQTAGPTDVPYTVFTHFIAADGFVRTSQDNQPVWNTYPTTDWSPGEKITDKYTLTIPPGTPAEVHHLRIGWYQTDTQERVPVLNDLGRPEDDQIILDFIIQVE